jgi:hypothetical protein
MASVNPPACPHNRVVVAKLRRCINSRSVRRAVLVATALLLAAPATAGAFSSSDLKGEWHGRLAQRGMPSFTVTSTIRSLHDARRNTVRYSGLDCSGTWTFLGARGSSFRFREVITAGKSETCKGAGTVTLVPLTANALHYRFAGGGVVSAGIIRRVR